MFSRALTKKYNRSGCYEGDGDVHPDGVEKLALQEGGTRFPNNVIQMTC